MSTPWRALLPSIITIGALVGLLAYGRIPQLPNYHAFADRRVVFAVPHWGDMIYAQLSIISGHTIKHLLATLSSVILVAQLACRERWSAAETPGTTPAPIHS